MSRAAIRIGGLLVSACLLGPSAPAQPPEDHVGRLKQSLLASRERVQHYEWIETRVLSLDGEEKSRTQNRCYYGADGALQKVPVSTPPAPKKKRGIRGKIAENKKEELADYMEDAVALVKSYVPPDAGHVQMVRDGGKISVDLLDPGRRVRVNLKDYLKPADTLSVEMDLTADRLLALRVSTYLATTRDAVAVDARFAALKDGTTYPDLITLRAPAKKLQVTIDNSGYRRMAE